MSEQVHYIGKIVPVKRNDNESLQDVCKRILNEYGCNLLPSYCDSWIEAISDELYEKYVVLDGELYKVKTKEYMYDSDIFHINKEDDGSLRYDVSYYNGGCCFEEALQIALNNMRKREL